MSTPIVRVGQARKVQCVCGNIFNWQSISWHIRNFQVYTLPEKMAEIEEKEGKERDRLQEEREQVVDLLRKEVTRNAKNDARM